MNLNEYLNKVYTIAFRLTGEEHIASDMAFLAIEETVSNLKPTDDVSFNTLNRTAKEVCRVFLSEPNAYFVNNNKLYGKKKKSTGIKTLQNALLTLEPINRIAVVWRDVLGFKIDDLAQVLDFSKQELYCELNAARMDIKEQLNK